MSVPNVGDEVGKSIGTMGDITQAAAAKLARNDEIKAAVHKHAVANGMDPSHVDIRNFNKNNEVLFKYQGKDMSVSHSNLDLKSLNVPAESRPTVKSTTAPITPVVPAAPPPTSGGGAGSSIYNSKGELKNWAHMDNEELSAFRNSIESEISAGNIPSKDLQYFKDIVIPDMESALQNPTRNIVPPTPPVASSPVKPSSPTTATKSVSNSAQASAQSPVRAGRQVNSSTSVPSRTNQPKSVTAAAATAESSPATARATTSIAPSATVTSKAVKPAEELAEEALRTGGGASTGAPLKGSFNKLRQIGNDASKAVSEGMHGSKNLRLAGAAAILGVGAIAMKKRSSQNDDYQRRLAMQRQGVYKQ